MPKNPNIIRMPVTWTVDRWEDWHQQVEAQKALPWPSFEIPLLPALTPPQAAWLQTSLPFGYVAYGDPRVDFSDWAFYRILCPERCHLVGWPDGAAAFVVEPIDPSQRDQVYLKAYAAARVRLEREWLERSSTAAFRMDRHSTQSN